MVYLEVQQVFFPGLQRHLFPSAYHIADIQQSGRTFQAVAGLRSGIRRERFGVFGKLRPGIQGYTATVDNSITFVESPFIDFALDAGGIIEGLYLAENHAAF